MNTKNVESRGGEPHGRMTAGVPPGLQTRQGDKWVTAVLVRPLIVTEHMLTQANPRPGTEQGLHRYSLLALFCSPAMLPALAFQATDQALQLALP